MTKTTVTQKLNTIEAEIQMLRTALQKRPDFAVDEVNWKQIKPALKAARKVVSKEVYG